MLLTSTWFGLRHKQNIRDFHPDFLVTANSWPLFLYVNGKYNPNYPIHGLFKGELLVKVSLACLIAILMTLQAFRYIFTSPSSAEFTADDLNSEFLLSQPKRRHRGEQRTHTNIATLLGMKTVMPHAIAYIAVQVSFFFSLLLNIYHSSPICQLHFALASCGSWRIIDVFFNYHQFYKNIVTFFEDITDTMETEEFIKELVLWWNRSVTTTFITDKTHSIP